MINIWQTFLFNPIFNLLVGLYKTTGSLGIAIIGFTLVARAILLPVSIPQIKMSKKQRDLQPQIDKLKKKFKNNKKKQAEAQMELFKNHGVNPGTGCITTIITLILMIAIYRAVSTITFATDMAELNSHLYFESIKFSLDSAINTSFLYLDLSKPDPYLVVTLLAVGLQFIATKIMMPISKKVDKAVKKTPGKTDDMMQMMQKQNMYIMPFMFLIFGLTLPSGVMLYIVVSTLFQIAQTVYFNGLGGLQPWVDKARGLAKKAS